MRGAVPVQLGHVRLPNVTRSQVLSGIVLVAILLGCASERRGSPILDAADNDTGSDDAQVNDSSTTDGRASTDASEDAAISIDATADSSERDAAADAEVLCDGARCCTALTTNDCQAEFHCATIDDGCGATIDCTDTCSGTDSCGSNGLCGSARDTCPGEAIALGMYLEATIEASLDGLSDDTHGCGAGDNADAVYHLKAPRNGRIHARVQSTGFTPVLYARQNACNTQILYSCHAPAPTFPASFTINVQAGTDYYFVVDSRAAPMTNSSYTLSVGYL